MHIAIFVDFHYSTIGGIQSSVVAQRQGLEQAGHLVTIFCPSPLFDAAVKQEVSIITLPNFPVVHPNGYPLVMPTKKNFQRIEKALEDLPSIDVVHLQSHIGVGVLGMKLAKKHGIPIVHTLHSREDTLAEQTYRFPRLMSWVAYRTHRFLTPHTATLNTAGLSTAARYSISIMVNQAEQADAVIVPSHHFRRRLEAWGVTRPMTVVSNGLTDSDMDIVRSAAPRTTNGASLQLMWCSRISAEKNPFAAIDAMKQLPHCHLDMYGDGPDFYKVRAYIKSQKLTNKITLKGRVSQQAVLKAALKHDILLFSSYNYDTQSIVLLEAMAAGLPVIYCDPDLSETLPQKTALLTATPDADGIVKAINELRKDPKKLTAMSTLMLRKRAIVSQSMSTKQIIKVYETVLKRRSA